MTSPETRPVSPKPDRSRYQYSLAELFALTTIIAIGLSLLKWLEIRFGLDIVVDLVVGGFYVACAAWLSADARKRGYPGFVAVLLLVFCGPFGAIFWVFVRPKTKVVIRPPAEYARPDDALAAAFQLDMGGDWDAAIILYAEAARRWPEHEQYAQRCITQVEEKRSRVKRP